MMISSVKYKHKLLLMKTISKFLFLAPLFSTIYTDIFAQNVTAFSKHSEL